jgi:hypothetical protein
MTIQTIQDIRTSLNEARGGFDEKFADDLAHELMRRIADASHVTDHPSLVVFRPIETSEALIRCLILTLACSHALREPSRLREVTKQIEKRLRREVRAAQDSGFVERMISKVNVEGHA